MLASRAAVEAGPASISSLSTTMPFLYQTKTLSSWALTGVSAVYRPRYQKGVFRRHFSSSMRTQFDVKKILADAIASDPAPLNTPKVPAEDPESNTALLKIPRAPLDDPEANTTLRESRLPIRRTTNISALDESSMSSWHFKQGFASGGELAKPKRQYKSLSRRTQENDFDMEDGIGFDEDIDDEDMLLGTPPADEIQDLTKKEGPRDSTITDQERIAFQKIFSDIFERSKRSGSDLASALETTSGNGRITSDDPTTPNVVDEASSKRSAKLKLDGILLTAMQRTNSSREEMEAAIQRYPPALRAAAAKAMGFVQEEIEAEKAQSTQGTLLDTAQLEELREPERARVEGLMKAARTDFELMEIMEREVFSMIANLGLADSATAEVGQPQKDSHINKGRKPKGWKAELKAQKEARKGQNKEAAEMATEATEALIPDQESSQTIEKEKIVSPLALYGPLYPSHLLLGLRLLDRSFAKPSPLTLSILPKIKSLGFISHVLGASTQLYNELLRIYRYRYDDFRGMIDLLNEMEQAALDFDEETLKIVIDVMRLQFSIRRGEKGSTIQALWAMPEFAPNGFKVWRETISDAINKKERQSASHFKLRAAPDGQEAL